MVDVLFIHPGGQKGIYQDLSNDLTAIAPPAWTALMADYVRGKGHSIAIYDANLEGWEAFGDVKNYPVSFLLTNYKPKLIVIWVYGHHPSASTQTMPIAGQIARDIKKVNRNIPIAMGGIHPSALPERTLEEEDIDYILKGEGVSQILSLINDIQYLGTNLSGKVYGKYYYERSPVDSFKNYAWDLLPSLDNYRAHNFHCFQDFRWSEKGDFSDVRSPYACLYTSVGCQHDCHYCCSNYLSKGMGVREWDLKTVLRWINELADKEVRNIRIHDNLFPPSRMKAFCEAVGKIPFPFNFSIYARLDTVKRDQLELMKAAGINWIGIGIESMSDSKNKDAKRVIKAIQKAGINVCGNYMFGMPDDDLRSMWKTFYLAMELNTEFANFYCCMAYPGSKLYEERKANILWLPNSWDRYSQHGYNTQPTPTKYLFSRDILAFRDDAFHEYFQSSKYLDMIGSKFGNKVIEHINKMTEYKLERRLLK